ncbi:PREDICTED: mediator of RNA polymerase II transcription subunit 15a isoform X2 [Prunus mume]|uniref:Mediator of RNA polymerase II transcription subunit 15a isoform X2 n=1 Tax=Prunus mume TaxID=102107 RepID=A0ABM0N2L0_PRUMU|nr:PREDICTED: mediator of RNA polymerase II transcription subunit 15a isoform X2 [Prunus mume]
MDLVNIHGCTMDLVNRMFVQAIMPTSLDSTAQTGHATGGDWQEEVFQKIKLMKEMYLTELSEIYQKIATKLQRPDSLPQRQLDRLKIFRTVIERLISVLQISKSCISPRLKDKLFLYEKQIVNFIYAYEASFCSASWTAPAAAPPT